MFYNNKTSLRHFLANSTENFSKGIIPYDIQYNDNLLTEETIHVFNFHIHTTKMVYSKTSPNEQQ